MNIIFTAKNLSRGTELASWIWCLRGYYCSGQEQYLAGGCRSLPWGVLRRMIYT